jgi:hypothetical protein
LREQHRITKRKPLLKDDGTLTEEGWATDLLLDYNKFEIRASWLRVKEWDYFYIIDHKRKHCLTCTMSDLGYVGLLAVCWIDFNKKKFVQFDTMKILPAGKIGLPSHSGNARINFENSKILMRYNYSLPKRYITIEAPDFRWEEDDWGLTADLSLYQDPDLESMVIATSWEKNRKAFYYNQKINCMPAKGTVRLGSKRFEFSPDSAMGGLDWGRGNWTYKNRWYWGSASGLIDGKSIGWNIGYGFSDRTPASENMIFYEGKAHKLDEVTFHFNPKDYMEPWKFTSNDGRFEMDFKPLVDRNSKINLLLVKSVQHQVFGNFTGYLILDDGTKIKVKDFLGFAEDVFNRL